MNGGKHPSMHPSMHPSPLHPATPHARDNAHLVGRDAVRLGALGTDNNNNNRRRRRAARGARRWPSRPPSRCSCPLRARARVGAEGCSSHGRTRAHAVSSLHWHALHTRAFRPRPRGRTNTRAHSPAHEHTRQRTHSAVWPRQRESARAQRSRTLASHTHRRHTRCRPDGPVLSRRPSAVGDGRSSAMPACAMRVCPFVSMNFGGRKFPARRRRWAVTSDDDVLGARLARDVHARRELRGGKPNQPVQRARA